MSMYRKVAAALILVAGIGLAAGCQSYLSDAQAANVANESQPGEVQVRQKVQFTDIPAPEVFVMRGKVADSFQGSAMRFGTLTYDGIWNTFNTSQWYLNEMPLNGWKLIKKEYPSEYGAEHTFVKGKETAIVSIYRYKGNTRVAIMINETPEEVAKIRAMARAGMVNLPGGPVRVPRKSASNN